MLWVRVAVAAVLPTIAGSWPCRIGEACAPRWKVDPYYPKFHVRPPLGGHNNDPAFPFRDPATGFW